MAQGQEVKKITIDGMEYAINDPAAALKNLPAKLVARIKMYDDKSEEAKFSGYDDGSKSRTLNIETRQFLQQFFQIGIFSQVDSRRIEL